MSNNRYAEVLNKLDRSTFIFGKILIIWYSKFSWRFSKFANRDGSILCSKEEQNKDHHLRNDKW